MGTSAPSAPPASADAEVHLLRKWTRPALGALPAGELEKLARSLSDSLSVGQIVIGRIMVELDAGRIADFWGCNSGKHFGRLVLQLVDWQVDEYYGVAKALEGLPLLTSEVEAGRIGWSKIREIVRKASPETEEFWIRMAATRSAPQIQKLVSRTREKGGLPGDEVLREPQQMEKFLLELLVDEEDRDLIQEEVARLSQEFGFRVTVIEAIRYYFMEHRLGDRHVTANRFREVLDWTAEFRQRGSLRDRQDAADARAEAEEMARDAGEGPSGVLEPEGPSGVPEPEPYPAAPYAPFDARAGASEVREAEAGYELPQAPWEAYAVREEPCPGAPDLILGTSAREAPWFEAGGSLLPPGASFDRRGRLRFNAESRTLTPGQAEYIRRRDGIRCAVPGCRCWIWLNAHHIWWYCRGGPTLPPNLVLVCSRCHKLIHERRLFVEGNAEIRLTWRDHRGRILGLDCTPDPAFREPLLPGEGARNRGKPTGRRPKTSRRVPSP